MENNSTVQVRGEKLFVTPSLPHQIIKQEIMKNPSDLHLFQLGFMDSDQIIDSYELIKGILVEFEGQASLKIKVDTTLPIIKGNLIKIKEIFTSFIERAIKILEQHPCEISLVHIKNSKSWVFAFLFQDFQSEVYETRQMSLESTLNDYTLAIPF